MGRSDSSWASSSLCAVKLFGRKEEIDSIISQITECNGDPFVIPISGSAGLGKTTLAQVAFHDEKVRNHFDFRFWVHSPDTSFDLMFVLRIILQSIAKNMDFEHRSLQELSLSVAHKIRGKRFLLVLDNFSYDYLQMWDKIISTLKSGSQGSVITVTTRSKKIADKIATTESVELSPLSFPDSKLLFDEIVLEPGEDSLPWDLKTTGREIVKKCSGVPSAIKGLALMLRFKRNQSQWQHILNGIKAIIELLILDHEFYEDLPLYLKSCIEYCALFPETYSFNKEHLTDLWVAEGFALPSEGRTLQLSYSRDDTIILFDKCFSCVQEPQYKIDSLWHNFAMRKNKGYFSTIEGRQTSIPAGCQSLSLVANSTTLEFPSELFGTKKLKTLILLREAEMITSEQKCQIREIPSILCQALSGLCVLDLQFSEISQLPDTISRLSKLRYLNLSQTEIAVVPESVGNLLSLQMLILSNCEKLTKINEAIGKLKMLEKLNLEGCQFLADLPRSMSNMEKLTYLNIFGCSLLYQMPANMGKLTNLETLSTYIASASDGCTITELQDLNNLRGKLHLKNLEKATSAHAKLAKLHYKTNIESLTLMWSGQADSEVHEIADSEVHEVADLEVRAVIENLRPNHILERLEIISYPGKLSPGWIHNLTNLVEIKLVNLKNVTELPPLGQLESLQIVEISGLGSIKDVDQHLFGENVKSFPSLKKLTFCYMPALKEWPELGEKYGFKCLEELCFIHCCKLGAVHMVLPTVKRLTMWMDNSLLYGEIGRLAGLSENLECVSIALCTKLSKSEQLKGLHELKGLKELEISGCEELTTVPDGVQFLTTLKSLTITSCSNFISLPDWLGNFATKNFIKVHDCPKFRSVPPELKIQEILVPKAKVPRTPFVQSDLGDNGVSQEVQVELQDYEAGVIGDTVNYVPGVVISEHVVNKDQQETVVYGKEKEKISEHEEQNDEFEKYEMTSNEEYRIEMELAKFRSTLYTHNNDGASSSRPL